MNVTLYRAVNEACEVESEKPLLADVLDPALQVIHSNMTEKNFKQFLFRLWEDIVEIFSQIVHKNSEVNY